METNFNSGLKNKLAKLTEIIKGYGDVCVAFSAGIDSTLLSFIASRIEKNKSLIVTVNSDFLSGHELDDAKKIASLFGFNHKILDINVFDNQDVIKNDPLICKYCKNGVMTKIIEFARKNGIRNILDGANVDDFGDYRPGLEAAHVLNIKSPFIEAQIGKADIREIAKSFNLPNWDKPASACLASRIPYNTQITREALNQVERAEDFIRSLGYKGFRVRHHGNIARVELDKNDIVDFVKNHREEVDFKLKELGYKNVCVDLNGYKLSGLDK